MVSKIANEKVLVVDDDDTSLEILCMSLTREGYRSTACKNGQEAWDVLNKNPHEYDVVLLDKMMQKMDGMEVLSRMQRHPVLCNVPVIMQTGDIGVEEAKESLAAGAYYYVTKPIDPDMMIVIVNAAIRNFMRKGKMSDQPGSGKALIKIMDEGKFTIRDIDDALSISSIISSAAKSPHDVNIALFEFITNAIEHGNLCIGYDLKKKLFMSGQFDSEVEKRLASPEYKDKRVYINLVSSGDEIEVIIRDEGQGFNWREFMEFDPLRLIEPNGRSIAIINSLLKVKFQYFERGNKVSCTFEKA